MQTQPLTSCRPHPCQVLHSPSPYPTPDQVRNRYLRCTSAPGKGVLTDGQPPSAESMSPGASHQETKAAYLA